MITWAFQKPFRVAEDGTTELYGVGDCLSTDTKPTAGIYNGSKLNELDTNTSYKFDAENKMWRTVSGAAGTVVFASAEEVAEVLANG